VDPLCQNPATRIYMTRAAQPWHVDSCDIVGEGPTIRLQTPVDIILRAEVLLHTSAHSHCHSLQTCHVSHSTHSRRLLNTAQRMPYAILHPTCPAALDTAILAFSRSAVSASCKLNCLLETTKQQFCCAISRTPPAPLRSDVPPVCQVRRSKQLGQQQHHLQ
jgi:hypothetical protein